MVRASSTKRLLGPRHFPFHATQLHCCTTFNARRGGPQYGWDKTPVAKKAWVSAVAAAGATLIAGLLGIPLLKRKVERDMAQSAEAAAAAAKT